MLAYLLTALVIAAALIAFGWFQRYRYTEAWRKGDLRAASFGFLLFFGGLFGHRLPPPPQARIEQVAADDAASAGRPTPLPDQAPDKEE